MSSELPATSELPGHARRRPPAVAALVTAAALLALPAGCGRRGDPQPPPNMAPAASRDLEVAQRGDEIRLLFAYPATAVSGLALPGIRAVEVWAMARPLIAPEDVEGGEPTDPAEPGSAAGDPVPPPPAEEVAPPAAAAGGDSGIAAPLVLPVWPMTALPPAMVDELQEAARPEPFDPADLARLVMVGRFAVLIAPPVDAGPPAMAAQEFDAAAQLLLTLEGAELERIVAGDRIAVTLPLPALPDGEELRAYAVATVSSEGRTSPRSPIVTIVPRPAPPSPIGLETRPVEDGVAVTWVARDVGIEGFNVYRRDAQSRAWGPALITRPPDARFYKDTTAVYGNRYVYTVTAVGDTAPLSESAIGAEQEVDYQDRYPPPVPARLVALPEEGRIRLLWDDSDAPDLAGYLVFRDAGSGFEQITPELVPQARYVDDDAASGRAYVYRVAAEDELGNRSNPSAPVEARAR